MDVNVMVMKYPISSALHSVFCEDVMLLFRRQLLVLYGTGYCGIKGSDVVDGGDCICVLMNDQVLKSEESVDLLAHADRECSPGDACLETYRLYNGRELLLDPARGVAYVGNDRPGAGRIYKERGVTDCGTRFIEVERAGSEMVQLRHDPTDFCLPGGCFPASPRDRNLADAPCGAVM